MKLTTTTSGRNAGSKGRLIKHRVLLLEKKAMDRKKYYVTRKAAHASQKLKAFIAICIA